MISKIASKFLNQRTTTLNKNIFYNFCAAQEQISLTQQDRIAYLTLSNPKKRNPLKSEVLDQLKEKLDLLEQQFQDRNNNLSSFPKCIVIQSDGPVFSAGHDLRELATYSEEEHLALFTKCGEIMNSIQNHSLPVIASVAGLATAAGCQLVASCDMVVASENSKYQTPGILIGLFCTTPAVPLVRAMNSKKKAFEMLVTGNPITAEEAYHYGLLNKVVKPEELEDETRKLAEKITGHSSETIALGKSAFYKQSAMPEISDAYDYATKAMTQNLQQEDCKEGVQSFVEKRHPKFKY